VSLHGGGAHRLCCRRMRRGAAVLFLLGLALVACKKGSSRLQGHWKGTRAEGVPADAQAVADRFAGQLEMDFKGDQVTVTAKGAAQSSRYYVLREDNGQVVISTDRDPEQTFLFESDTTMRWSLGAGQTITLKKD
jgi:hypothetical protein